MRERRMQIRLVNIALAFLVFMSSAVALVAAGEINLPTPPQTVGTVDFLVQVFQVMQAVGGMATMMKVSSIIMLVTASMKVGFLNKALWSKLGAGQVWVAPVLGLFAGVLGLGTGGAALTPQLLFAYVVAGGGAVFLHELLDSLKAVPGLGAGYVKAIDLVDGALGGAVARANQVAPPSAAAEKKVS